MGERQDRTLKATSSTLVPSTNLDDLRFGLYRICAMVLVFPEPLELFLVKMRIPLHHLVFLPSSKFLKSMKGCSRRHMP